MVMKIKDIKSKLLLVLIEILNHSKNNFGIREYKIVSSLIKAINDYPNYLMSYVYLTVCVDDPIRKFRYVDSIEFNNDSGICVRIENCDYYYGSDTFEVEFLRLSSNKGKAVIDYILIDESKEGYDFDYWIKSILGLLDDENVEIKMESYVE